MRLLSLFFCLFLLPAALFGGYSHVSGKWSPERFVPHYSVQEHYDLGSQEFHKQNWDDAFIHFMVITYHFAGSPFYQDALFYSAICYLNKKEYDVASKQFDRYLTSGGKLKHFEKVFDYKLEIANKFAQGTKRHLFGIEKLPKWAPAKGNALDIYDEIVAALPGKDIAAQALYNKADLLRVKRQYKESIEALQTLSRRFPKHSLAAESYLRISEIYLDQSRLESQNPDLIALAQVNIQRFVKSFPSDERVDAAKKNVLAMQEVYAQSLYDTGRFYERKKKPNASAIYYEDTVRKYPGTQAAVRSEERLTKILSKLEKRA
jgi:outer membrane protein assembly factor BamD (BamD/ComL family)